MGATVEVQVSGVNGAPPKEPKVLDLADLSPERPKVRLRNGAEYEVLAVADMSPIQWARFDSITDGLEDGQSPVESVEAAEKHENAVRQKIGMIMPDIPEDELGTLSYMDAIGILDFFLSELEKADALPAPLQSMADRGARARQQKAKPKARKTRTPSRGSA